MIVGAATSNGRFDHERLEESKIITSSLYLQKEKKVERDDAKRDVVKGAGL